MGIGNYYWLILGTYGENLQAPFDIASNRFIYTFIGHFIWMLSPIFIYFGIREPICISPKKDDDYSDIGMNKFQKLVNEEILAMYLVKNKKIIYSNPLMQKLLEYTSHEVLNWKLIDILEHIHPSDQDQVLNNYTFNPEEFEINNFYEFRYITKSKKIIWVRQTNYPIFEYDIPVFQYVFEDITKRKQFELEKKTLEGMLPICARCKKIRNDEGYYIQIEKYLHEHSDVEFTHGLCPKCVKDTEKEMEIENIKS